MPQRKNQEKIIEAKADWSHWKQMSKVYMWQAVCLSFDIEPNLGLCVVKESLHVKGEDLNQYVERFKNTYKKLNHRLEIAISNKNDLDTGMGYLNSGLCHGSDQVHLNVFGDWASRQEYDIPGDFPTTATARKRDGWIQIFLPHYPEQLQAVHEALIRAYNRKETSHFDNIVEEVFNEKEIEFSAKMKDSVAQIIKPDPLKNKDGRSSKHRSKRTSVRS